LNKEVVGGLPAQTMTIGGVAGLMEDVVVRVITHCGPEPYGK